jgi:hypothetical protein
MQSNNLVIGKLFSITEELLNCKLINNLLSNILCKSHIICNGGNNGGIKAAIHKWATKKIEFILLAF